MSVYEASADIVEKYFKDELDDNLEDGSVFS
jgi:hypothetical protein